MKKWFAYKFSGFDIVDTNNLMDFANRNKLIPGELIIVPRDIGFGHFVNDILYFAEEELK